jgi:microsomal prostaglandin-E synthase 2
MVGLGCAYGYQQYWARRAANALVIPTEYHLNQRADINNLFGHLGTEADQAYLRLQQMPFTLYQFATCPYCNKVKAFLDRYGIPYDVVEVDPFNKKELKSHAYKKVPQLKVGSDGPLIVDSTEIVNLLSPVVGASLDSDVEKWRTWGSSILVRYVVLKMNSGISDTVANYRYIQSQDISTSLKMKYLSAGAVMFIMAHGPVKKNLRKEGCKVENVSVELEAELSKWMKEAVGANPFQGGETPSPADTDIFGILQSIKGHRVYNELRDKSPVTPWMERMEQYLAKQRSG